VYTGFITRSVGKMDVGHNFKSKPWLSLGPHYCQPNTDHASHFETGTSPIICGERLLAS